ncbi:hypothetical protein LZ31DRAFT_138460 [Colletotrichum somersetense]|nr:hypothetical protein LZ31DRAFT_138460 [Colletotrichum somersetense]
MSRTVSAPIFLDRSARSSNFMFKTDRPVTAQLLDFRRHAPCCLTLFLFGSITPRPHPLRVVTSLVFHRLLIFALFFSPSSSARDPFPAYNLCYPLTELSCETSARTPPRVDLIQ